MAYSPFNRAVHSVCEQNLVNEELILNIKYTHV